ncbi:MAG: cytochrome c [Rhodospirillales bacterium]|nr:cytochrome c [Rhodospirillales bacterium]
MSNIRPNSFKAKLKKVLLVKTALVLFAWTFGIASFVQPSPTAAAEMATGAVRARVDNMQSMARAHENLGDMLRGKMEYNKNVAKAYADALQITNRFIVKWFENKDMTPPSEAKADIWSNWDDFEKLSALSYAQTQDLYKLVRADGEKSEILGQYLEVTESCSNCHQKYRKSGPGVQPPVALRHGTQ